MSIKKYFDKQKEQTSGLRGLTKSTVQQLTESVESEAYVKEFTKGKNEFIPNVDYSDPANFVKFGSATKYYEDAIKRIYSQYPYDGSAAEQLAFYNELTPLEKHIFDNLYPTSTGYVNFDGSSYVTFNAGPHVGNVYNTASNQGNNLKFDSDVGNTIEFWMKKTDLTADTEVIFTATASLNYFQINYTGSVAGTLSASFDGTTVSLDTGLTTIADAKWHHYALVFDGSASLYVDRVRTDKKTYTGFASAVDMTTGYVAANSSGTSLLSASLDDFRFWKTTRTAKQIGRNYLAPVNGGTNTDTNKYYYTSSIDNNSADLGVYYKFNEGITGNSAADALVLDYSGRVSNGTFVGYSTTSRHTGSAMVLSTITKKEKPDPILYSTHPEVVTLSTNLAATGAFYDEVNNGSLYNSIPQWIREEDEDTQNISKLTQIMGSYLDTLYGQVGEINKLQDTSYTSGSGAKPTVFGKRLLQSKGFDAPELFVDGDVLEEIFSRDEKRVYEEKLYNLKNLIYKNIYNNLSYINKSKGTEKAFRNLFRCYGVDDNLFRINIYGNDVEHTLRDTHESTTTKTNAVDFSGIKRALDREATVFQYPSSSTDYGYVSASTGDLDIPFTAEAEILFPKVPDIASLSSLETLVTASLFGCYGATGTPSSIDLTTYNPDFQVYSVKDTATNRTHFKVTSSTGHFPTITSPNFHDVYEDSKWNLAIRVRPQEHPFSSYVTASSLASFEFYGVNVDHGTIVNEFSLSQSMSATSASLFTTVTNKRFYAGALRQNFSGTLTTKSDIRLSSLRCWGDYLTDLEIQYHAKDPSNYGRLSPDQNSFVWEGNIGFLHVPRIDTLALNWDFTTVTSSDASGRFSIQDLSSGSAAMHSRYPAGHYSAFVKNNHTGRGQFFEESSQNVVSIEFIPTSKQLGPENLHSSDLIEILTFDDTTFVRETRPTKHYFAIEASMYDLVSTSMMNFFASIEDFNNQIGEPIYMYRDKYKGMDKLRNLFFERVNNIPDVDKFVKLYKWLDQALDSVVANLVPLSANISGEVRTIIESHILERNKYRHKYHTIKDYVRVDNDVQLRATEEAEALPEYDMTAISAQPTDVVAVPAPLTAAPMKRVQMSWDRPPLDLTDESEAASWWKNRAEQDKGHLVSSDTEANTSRAQLRANRFRGKQQENFGPVTISAKKTTLFSGPNIPNKRWDNYKGKITEGDTSTDGMVAEFDDATANKTGEPYVYDQSLTGSKRRVPMKVKNSSDNAYHLGQESLPFTVMSSSVQTGYQSALSGMDQAVAIEEIHHDIYGPHFETTMQGPFPEENVGGSDYRHGQLFDSSSQRKEGFIIEVNGTDTLNVFGPRHNDTNKSYGTYYRDEVAKRPVVIKNVKQTGSSDYIATAYVRNSNYQKDYEIVHTFGRRENNKYLKSVDGVLPVSASSSYVSWSPGAPVYDFPLPERPANEHIIVNRFSNRTGLEGESEGYLDRESAEYSVYNANPYQALTVKESLNELSSRFNDTHGQDPFYGSPIQSFHKTHRNTIIRPHTDSASISLVAEEFRDNLFVQHQIPRSDINYKWINDSWIVQRSGSGVDGFVASYGHDISSITASDYLPLMGFEYSADNLRFVSQSEVGTFITSAVYNSASPGATATYVTQSSRFFGTTWDNLNAFGFIPVDFVGMNHGIYEPVSSSTNTLGYRGIASLVVDSVTSSADALVLVEANYVNRNFVKGLRSGYLYPQPHYFHEETFQSSSLPGVTFLLNAINLHRNGPYGYPTWKQVRTGQHPVARYHKNNNIYESHKKVYDPATDVVKDKITRIIQSPVTIKHKPIKHNLEDHMIQYEFGNDYHHYGTTYDSSKKEIKDYNSEFNSNVEFYNNSTLFKMNRNDGLEWSSFRYSETIWPKDENVYRSVIRDKPFYVTIWNDDIKYRVENAQYKKSSQSDLYNSFVSYWPMDAYPNTDDMHDPGGGVSGEDFDISGELMSYDNEYFILNHAHIDGGSFSGDAAFYARVSYGRNYSGTRPRNFLHSQAGTGAFYNSYDEFATDIRPMGKDYSLLPQFSISDYVKTIGTEHNFDFYQDIYDLELAGVTGSDHNTRVWYSSGFNIVTIPGFSKEKFHETYVNSEIVTHLDELKEEFGEPQTISIKMDGILKLLPLEGFYPMQRTVQMATQFSQSYGLSSAGSTTHAGALETIWQTTLKPFFAPGIMYNSIKSGMAVDYPVIDKETYDLTVGDNYDLYYPSGSTGSYTKRLPFETIVEPEFYCKLMRGTAEISSSDNITFYDHDPDMPTIVSTGTLGQTDGVYENMSHNFFAEVPNFFLKDLTSFKSKPVNEWKFDGPLSSSTGIKKWAMDVKVVKTDNFTMHNNPGYFGHSPYTHHTPPYYALRDSTKSYWKLASSGSALVGSASYYVSSSHGGIPPAAAHYRNTAIATIVFDPSKIADEDPIKFNSGKFSYEDIVSNTTITYKNEDLQAQYAASPTAFSGTIDNKFMKLDASVNMFNKTQDNRWVVGTKWETPVLNFANVSATSSAGTNSTLQANRSYAYAGMWHQYGQTCAGSEGLFMTVTTPRLSPTEKTLTGSLATACGFSTKQKRIGDIKLQKEIREAVCAIPFYIDSAGQEKFFDIPLDSFEQAFSDLQQAKEAAKTVKKKGEDFVLALENSISDMIHKMSKYIVMPQYDFAKVRSRKGAPIFSKNEYTPALPPFAMYIFEFSTLLKYDDLKKIWQGVMPEIAVTAETQDITISHPIQDKELISPLSLKELELNEIPSDIRWKIFKIKRRAHNDYYTMLEEQFDLPANAYTRHDDTLSSDFGHNWPYDYCSLVEMGKMEVSFDFKKEIKEEKKVTKEREEAVREITIARKDIVEELSRPSQRVPRRRQPKTREARVSQEPKPQIRTPQDLRAAVERPKRKKIEEEEVAEPRTRSRKREEER